MTSPPPAPRRADVVVDGTDAPGAVRVPDDALGLSVEWSMVEHWFGTSRETASPVTSALLQSLQRDRTTAGVLRIGGDSQDGYRWVPDGDLAGNALFRGTVNAGLVDALLEVADRSGWKLLLGLDLRADVPDEAAAMAAYASTADTGGSLLGVEVGNEPNAYFRDDVAGYVERYDRYADALSTHDGDEVLVGPAISHLADLAYVRALTTPDSTSDSRVGLVTWHHYANQPTRGGLLGDGVRTAWQQRIAAVTDAAQGVPHRMGEGNSVGSGGLDGVSNVLASATWVVDAFLSGTAAGLAGTHLHSWDGAPYPAEGRTCWYTPFVLRGGAAQPRPPFYGLALLRHAPGRVFRPVTVTPVDDRPVGCYALADERTGRLYVYVLDRSGRGGSGTVGVTVPAGLTGTAYLARLGDAGGCAGKTTGINGAKLPPDGAYTWPGRTVRPAAGTSRYDLALGPCEVLLLSVGP
jgi:hypothetical protein